MLRIRAGGEFRGYKHLPEENEGSMTCFVAFDSFGKLYGVMEGFMGCIPSRWLYL